MVRMALWEGGNNNLGKQRVFGAFIFIWMGRKSRIGRLLIRCDTISIVLVCIYISCGTWR